MSELGAATAIVIDTGGGQVKAGLAGEDAPFAVFPTIVGEPKQKNAMSGVEAKSLYVGNEASQKRGILSLKYPVEHGVITDWAAMEMIWGHTFNSQLRVTPSDHPVLLSECPMNPKSNREKMMEIMFDTFQAPAAYVQITAVLALYASGRTTGLVLDSGDAVTHSVPIYEGFAVRKTTLRGDAAGRDITHALQRELKAEGVSLSTSAEFETVRDIKEKLCYVADNFAEECGRPLQDISADYTLPDGNVISVGQARFKAAEAMFDPKTFLELEDDYGGICGQIASSIATSEVDLRAALARNIVLAGGNTMTANFAQRLEQGLSIMLSSEPKVYAPPERKYSAWIGGSILASLSSFASMAVTKDEYDAEGAAVVHRKCF
ncbi:Actin-like protein [Akanthomyces lecanii RCEF 1005]|uniref:Centractin n=1 Tax=Akanthomyces lecanii RCEF 1005 TaxID=1081108 RepID=A0A168G1F7_CORDF|nr:Actin-like protein [Akanthomyces lecanii RCEF 1005]